MRKINMLCYIGMNFQVVILFFVTAIIENALANECGSTSSMQDGNTAVITYSPDPGFVNHQRTWYHSFGYNEPYGSPVVVFDSTNTASRPERYTEKVISSHKYMLLIHDVARNDSGLYSVRCFTDGRTTYYSKSTTLQITRVPTATTRSYTPSTKQVSTQTPSVRRTTSQQTLTVTTPIIQTAETSRNMVTEETSQQKETDDGALIVPVIGGVVAIVAVVVVCAVLLTVYHKRCKKQESKPPAQSKAKGSITAHLLGDNEGTEKTLSTEEIPEYASVKPKDKRKCAEKTVDGSDECPEYSKVAPKNERTSDAKNDVQTKSICETTEAANNQLVYAELDLEHPKANTKDTERHQETDQVEIGLSKTRSSHDSKRVTEQLEQTEYVTIDFSKTDQVN